MRRGFLIGGVCFLLGAISLALAQTTAMRPDQFVATSWTWSKAQAVTPVALTPGAGTIAVNASSSNGFTLTIGNNSNVLGNPANLIPGQNLNFQFTVGTGGFTGFSTGTAYKYTGGTAPTWSTAAGKIDVLSCWAVTTSILECFAGIDVR
jgi:hypothetical protein